MLITGIKVEGTPLQGPLVTVIHLFSAAVVWAQSLDQNAFPNDALATGKSLTVAEGTAFSNKFPLGVSTSSCGKGAYQEKGIYLYSFTGNRQLTNIFDVDSSLATTGLLIKGENDGLIPKCSTRFGKTIRDDYAWNHIDEINQFFGLRALLSQDPVQVYREHANRLKLQGL